MKTQNQRAWFFVLPVLLLVAFNALIPMMTVVNYSVQETFGDNLFFWEGLRWFQEVLQSERFHNALGRQFFFTFMILPSRSRLASRSRWPCREGASGCRSAWC
jgi:glycerol transport system permease protein